VAEFAATLVLAVALLVAVWGRRHAPEADCGCFGARPAPVSRRTVARAGTLTALALVAAIGGEGWTQGFTDPVAGAICLAAGAALVLMSPELVGGRDAIRERLRPGARSQRVRDAACALRRVPLERSLARLHRSDLWRTSRRYLSSEVPAETWQEGCWRYVCYPASYEGERVTAVFALALRATRASNAVAFVDEQDRRVLGQISGDTEPGSIKCSPAWWPGA
jgi:hypothetical protein